MIGAGAAAQNAAFNVTVNTGVVAPNSDTVYPGEPTSVRITLSNNSTGSPLTGVGYSKPLPTTSNNGLLVNGTSVISGDPGCIGGTLSTTSGEPGISLSGLTVPPRREGVAGSGECYLDIPIAAYSVNGNSTSLSYSLDTGEVSSNEGVNATGGPQAYTIRSTERPSWTKNLLSDDLLVIGGASRNLQITVNNRDDNVPLTNVAFTDVFPSSGSQGAIMEPTGTPASGSCGANVVLTQGNAAQIAASDINLNPGESCTIDVAVRARHSDGVYNLEATNSIPASGFSSKQGLTPAADATDRVQVRSPLAVTKNFQPNIVASGEDNSFRITLTNNGNIPLPITDFSDNPIAASPHQARLNIGSTSDIINSCGGDKSLENGGQGFSVSNFSIPAEGSCQIDVTYVGETPDADTPTTYTNQIAAGAVQTSVDGIVSEARSATVLVVDRLRVLKSGDSTALSPGDPQRYQVTVQNFSTVALANVTVQDILQNNSSLLLGTGYTPTLTQACGALGLNGATQGDSSVTFSIETVPARSSTNTPGSCTIEFWVMIDPDAELPTVNNIAAGGVCFGSEPEICNQVDTGDVTTDTVPTITLQKTFDNQDAVAKTEGTTSRLRLQINNSAVTQLSNLTISDTLPTAGPFQQLRLASPPNISNTCGGTVTAVAGDTSVALNGGIVPARATTVGSCALEVDVVGPPGTYPNTADTSAVRQNANGTTTLLNANDDATLTYNDALRVSKFFDPISVGPNGRATAGIRFTSLDAGKPITGISVTDDLPPGMVVANPANSYTSCNGDTTLEVTPGSGQVTLSGASLAPLAICELRFDVSVSGSSNWVNTIPAGGITADGGLTNRNPVTATLLFEPPEMPLISKSINPGTIVPGQSALLTINLTNGGQALTNLEVSDHFTLDGTPGGDRNGMEIAAAPQASTDCPLGVLAAQAEGTSVRLSGVSLAPNTQCQVQVQVTSTTAGTLTNTIPLDSITTDQGATNSTTFAQSTLSTTSSIGVSKRFDPPVVSPTQPSRLRITIYNAQAESVSGLSITDQFPDGLVLAPEPNPFSSCGGSVNISFPSSSSIMMSDGRIAAAQGDEASSCYIETSVVAATEGDYLNTIPANSLSANGTPISHPPTEAELRVRERLIVNKAFDNLTLDMGDPADFTTGVAARLPGVPAAMTIRIENPNTIALTKVNFTDTLPDGLVLAQNPELTTDCTDGLVAGVSAGRDVRLTGATLPATGEAGAICTVTANVVSNIAGVYTNEIPTGDVTSFEGIDNDPGTQAQIIIASTPGLSKDISPPVIAPGASALLTIIIENENELATSLSSILTDTLPTSPGAMTVATPSVISTTCPGGESIVTAVAGEGSVSIAEGAVIPPNGCIVTAQITATEPGDYLNHIPVGALNTAFGLNDVPAQAPLKVSTLGYIAGRVFLDNQATPDGTYIPGSSTPIAGNSIELHSGSSCTGTALFTVPTDAMGNYLFSELAAGTYSVCQPTQPPATLNSVTVAGVIVPYADSTGTPGAASNPPGGTPTSQIVGIVLNNNGNADEVSGSPENNFSEYLPASVGGNVYYDANNNGIFDPDESGIGGVTVTLSGTVDAYTQTNADGSYSFSGLPPGTYTLVETQPSPWTDGKDTLGTVNGSPNGDDSVNDTFSAIVLAPGDSGIEYNFGETLANSSLVLNANAYCENNAPVVSYNLPVFAGESSPPPVSIEWYTTQGRLADQLLNQPASGVLLWPGAEVDTSGNGVSWPGWLFVDDQWVRVNDDRIPEMILRISVNATTEVLLQYPLSTPGCLTQPPGTYPPDTKPIPVMAPTMLWLLSILIALTGFWSTRRRN